MHTQNIMTSGLEKNRYDMKNQMTISIVLPIYNEEENIPAMYNQLNEIFAAIPYYIPEFIFINDGSKDNSWQLIEELAFIDSRIKAINFSRNFGHQIALTAGYDTACGDAIISMDADLQDPPWLLPQLLDHWKNGYNVVYARRTDRNENFLKRKTAGWYYKFLERIADVKIPRNVGDFRLIDRQVLEYIKQCREKSRYLRGIVAWAGFSHTFVDFARPNRTSGKTGYTWAKMVKLAFDGVTGFSLFPLKLAAFIGIFVILTGIGMFIYITIDALFFKIHYPLFKWLVTIIYMFVGVQFLLLWIIGEYIGRIFEQQKGRPLYIIAESLNLDQTIQNKQTVHIRTLICQQ